MNTGSDGKVTSKTESLANAKATKYDGVDYDDVKVAVFGDTAIATGDFKANAVPVPLQLSQSRRRPFCLATMRHSRPIAS